MSALILSGTAYAFTTAFSIIISFVGFFSIKYFLASNNPYNIVNGFYRISDNMNVPNR